MEAIELLKDGAKAFGEQDFDRAESCFRKALKLDPDHHEVLFNLGTVMFIKRQNLESLRFYRKALDVKPGYVSAGLGIAKLYLSDGNPARALEELQALNRANGGELNQQGEFCKLLGIIHAAQGDHEAAGQFFQKYRDADPDSIDPWECMARSRYDQGDKEEAIKVLEQALEVFAGHPQLLVDLVQYHAEQPFTRQFHWMEQLLDAMQPNDQLYEFCAKVCMERKKYAHGMRIYQRV